MNGRVEQKATRGSDVLWDIARALVWLEVAIEGERARERERTGERESASAGGGGYDTRAEPCARVRSRAWVCARARERMNE